MTQINRHLILPLCIGSINLLLFIIAIISLPFRDTEYRPSWIRCIICILLPFSLAYRGLKNRSVDITGAAAGVMIAISMVLSSYVVTIALITCYLATSKATRTGEEIKSQFEANYKRGGQRNWLQVISNLGWANLVVLLRLIFFGCGERNLDFIHSEHWWDSWLLLSSLLSISAALGDTFSSELGPVMFGTQTDPLLITTFRRVPRGTNGGVTIDGLIAACIGGFAIGLCSYISIISFTSSKIAQIPMVITPQWPLLHFCLYSGLIGSIIDSYMGAIFQYTGYDRRTRRIIEEPPEIDNYGPTMSNEHIEHITGKNLLDNHEVNLLMTSIIGLTMPIIATLLWPHGFGDRY